MTEPKKIVQKEWVSLKDNIDSFKKDSIYQIEIVFDWLTEKSGIQNI